MQKISLFLLLLFSLVGFTQQSDFKNIDFKRADYIAKRVKVKRLYNLNELTFKLTQNLDTDVEKIRAIYVWICTNIANDFGLYAQNERRRNRYKNDSIKLQNWNSKFKTKLFKKLLKRKKTICTGYAYLFTEMCNIINIESKMVNGFGRTSTVDFSKLTMPNHTWNIVKLNNKWYVCDPTWSTGISFPEEGRFQFDFNDGYFLTEPTLFLKNHYPLETQFSLLGHDTPTFLDFTEMPLFYGDAYKYLKKHQLPLKMYHQIKKDSIVTFQYQLKKNIALEKLKFVIFSGNNERYIKPIKSTLENNTLTLKHRFKTKGFYDFHLYIDDKIIATYVYEVKK
ncbi:transglutaminase domain-containing protein [Polaribacter sp.]|uniref:transglutaminase domain-containing protein n=1 Tax=Polaribacter sp. TaxID=1920175 RepID=UPI003F6A55AD